MITNLYFKNKLSYVWDADFLAFWARTSGTPDSWKVPYNDLFLATKASGIYSKLSALLLLCGHNDADSRINLTGNIYNPDAINSPTFTPKIGFTGNGSTSYLNSNYIPFNDSNVTKNSFHIACNLHTAANNAIFGDSDGSESYAIWWIEIGGNIYNALNSSYSINAGFTSPGLLSMKRSNALGYAIQNGAINTSVNIVSDGLSSNPLYILARNAGGVLTQNSSATISSYAIGQPFDEDTFDIIIGNFKTAIAAL